MTSQLKFGFGLLLIGLVGCVDVPPKAPPANPTPATPDQVTKQAPIGRFQVIGPTNMVALDTKTGLACKTWDWGGSKSTADFPSCVDLMLDDYKEVNKIIGVEYVESEMKEREAKTAVDKEFDNVLGKAKSKPK